MEVPGHCQEQLTHTLNVRLFALFQKLRKCQLFQVTGQVCLHLGAAAPMVPKSPLEAPLEGGPQ